MTPHSRSIEDILHDLDTDAELGLSEKQVLNRQEKYGKNSLTHKENRSLLSRFINQFKDVMILILIAAAIVSFVIAAHSGSVKEFFEPALILLIVVLNAAIGTAQESKAEKALSALKSLSAPHARVIRSGREQSVNADLLVPGDIIKLEAGDYVPADARLLRSSSLKCEESALTGESIPAEKNAESVFPEDTPPGDRVNMVFSGCSITYGTALAVVCQTGMNTQLGKIAGMLSEQEDVKTPLQLRLAQLGKYLGITALAACAVIFAVGLASGIPVMEIFMTSVSLAVSAIPEGLPAIVTVVLALGVQRMADRGAIIRSLPAVETLGGASVICSDKTGTLTQNRMTLTEIYSDDKRLLLEYAVLCCNGAIEVSSHGVEHLGDPTETAIIYAAYKDGIEKSALEEKYPRLAEIPFDSNRKLMTSINNINGKTIAIVKGAFDVMIDKITDGDTDGARRSNELMSNQALRVLAVAYRELEEIPEDLSPEAIESDLTLLGLVGMIDPPREEAISAVSLCRQAGIQPVMITGDHAATACAVAEKLGIRRNGDEVLTGKELDAMSDDELDSRVEKTSVYARVSPENKIRIVKAWQRKGNVVAMTGDGVNDAPALKAADIGCAMGITGTDVAKGAADMTLTDDNFATIVDAVREGRGIFANIRKVVAFLLGTNIGEVLCVFAAMMLWHLTPLLSMQLLWINLVTDSLPAIALGMENVESDIMNRPPRQKDEGIFSGGLGIRVILQGVMFGGLSLAAFAIGRASLGNIASAQTMAFIVLALSQVLHAYNMRSKHSIFHIGVFSNRKLNIAAVAAIVLIAVVVFTPVSIAFGLTYLPVRFYLAALALSLVPLPIMELAKIIGVIKH